MAPSQRRSDWYRSSPRSRHYLHQAAYLSSYRHSWSSYPSCTLDNHHTRRHHIRTRHLARHRWSRSETGYRCSGNYRCKRLRHYHHRNIRNPWSRSCSPRCYCSYRHRNTDRHHSRQNSCYSPLRKSNYRRHNTVRMSRSPPNNWSTFRHCYSCRHRSIGMSHSQLNRSRSLLHYCSCRRRNMGTHRNRRSTYYTIPSRYRRRPHSSVRNRLHN